jgi:hypothetical protein
VGDALGVNRRMPGNMFVPVDLLKPILSEMQQSGSSRQSHRPWLGVTSSDQGGRVQIVRVSPDSPAEEREIVALSSSVSPSSDAASVTVWYVPQLLGVKVRLAPDWTVMLLSPPARATVIVTFAAG